MKARQTLLISVWCGNYNTFSEALFAFCSREKLQELLPRVFFSKGKSRITEVYNALVNTHIFSQIF